MKKFFSSAIVLFLLAGAYAQHVGIGNTSPLMKLHVSSLSDTALLLIDNNTTLAQGTSTGMYFKNGAWYTGGIRTIGTGSNVARMGIYTYASGTVAGLRERMSITDDGFVGIGNISPVNAGLVVDAKAGATNAMFGSNTTGVAIESSYPGIAFNTYYSGSRKFIADGYGGLLGLDPTNGNFTMYNTGSGGAAGAAATIVERLRIANNGDVVIGTGASFGRLTINGDNSSNGNGAIIYTNTGTTTALRVENFGSTGVAAGLLAYSQNGTAILASNGNGAPVISVSGNNAISATGNSQLNGDVLVGNGPTYAKLTVNGNGSNKGVQIYTSSSSEGMRIENFTSGINNTALLVYSQSGTGIAVTSAGFPSALNVTGGSGWAIEASGNSLFSGNVTIVGTLSKSAGTFKIDHPLDPANKYLIHSFVESPDMLNVYNGNIVTDKNGMATVQLPSYFEAENIDFKYQLTVMGKSFAQAIVYDEVKGNSFTIKTNEPNVKVSWQVTGVRNDAYAKKYRIKAEEDKTGEAKGKYLSPELFKGSN